MSIEVFYLDYVHPPLWRTQVSDRRNASFIVEILLAATITCAEGRWILDGIGRTSLGVAEQGDIVISILQAMPDDCTHDEYNPPGRFPQRK